MGSTVSRVDPGGSLEAHSGSITAEIASMVDGKALPTTNAKARPAMTARYNGRASIRVSPVSNVADIVILPGLLSRTRRRPPPQPCRPGAPYGFPFDVARFSVDDQAIFPSGGNKASELVPCTLPRWPPQAASKYPGSAPTRLILYSPIT